MDCCWTNLLSSDNFGLFSLPLPVIQLIFSYLDPKTANSLEQVISVKQPNQSLNLPPLKCSVMNVSFNQDILGFQLSSLELSKNPSLISLKAFQQLKVQGIRGIQDLSFNSDSHFLPIVINQDHFDRAFEELGFTIYEIAETLPRRDHGLVLNLCRDLHLPRDVKTPHMASLIIRRILNKLMVRLLKDLDCMNTEDAFKMGSVNKEWEDTITKAMSAYFHLVHLLLMLANKFPSLVDEAELCIGRFINDSKARNKKNTPNLGEFLFFLTLSKRYTWEDVEEIFLEEMMARNVFWLLQPKEVHFYDTKPSTSSTGCGMGFLAFLEESPVSEFRLTKSWQGTAVSYRLALFQKLVFLNLCKCLSRKAVAGEQLEQRMTSTLLLEFLTQWKGVPPNMIRFVIGRVNSIMRVDSLVDFFSALSDDTSQKDSLELVRKPSLQEICLKLKEAVRRSEGSGYHFVRLTTLELKQWRASVDPSIPSENEFHRDLTHISFSPCSYRK